MSDACSVRLKGATLSTKKIRGKRGREYPKEGNQTTRREGKSENYRPRTYSCGTGGPYWTRTMEKKVVRNCSL